MESSLTTSIIQPSNNEKGDFMTIKMIAFDADDTLWHAEVIFRDAEEKFCQILLPWKDRETIKRTLFDIETRNISRYGFGAKSYTFSMIETALVLSESEISGKAIEKIMKIGHAMLDAEFELLPGVRETLERLNGKYPLMVITKGDLLEQTSKVVRSSLSDYFDYIEVLSNKSTESYEELFGKLELDPESFVMVGNSLPSDIQPILSLGGIGVHIPADTTWAHELMDDFDSSQFNFYEIENIGQLPGLITKIN
jgi:putative hydrolase of the HAD superfamily